MARASAMPITWSFAKAFGVAGFVSPLIHGRRRGDPRTEGARGGASEGEQCRLSPGVTEAGGIEEARGRGLVAPTVKQAELIAFRAEIRASTRVQIAESAIEVSSRLSRLKLQRAKLDEEIERLERQLAEMSK